MRKLCLGLILLGAPVLSGWAEGQGTPSANLGRVSLFVQGGNSSPTGGTASRSYLDAWAYVTVRSSELEGAGVEFGVDSRGSSYGRSSERDNRFQLYEAFVGGRLGDGTVGVRAGQMWVNELGALGSVGGLLLDYRARPSKIGKARFGIFGGLEPRWTETGYVSDVRKGGVYATVEGEGARRHTLGYVLVRTSGVTERSVVVFNNYIPVGRDFFVYEAAEYDLAGPGGIGNGGLTYLIVTARYAPGRKVDFQVNVHRGRSIDSRTITQDTAAGRPVSPAALTGYLFESAGGRVSVEVSNGIRLWGGYSLERNNKDDAATSRYSGGFSIVNLAQSGVDVSLSSYSYSRPVGSYTSWFASIGRSVSRKVYVSADFSTALSVIQLLPENGVKLETRPRSQRFTLNSNVFLDRHFSLLITGEFLKDEYTRELRGLLGITYRF
ncbi:MAG: hypothetical protein L6R30_17170 [Thermoanaerobaculia bacterium]|nr:hypothetical protein [Thermoanaerobaculia bacterium]